MRSCYIWSNESWIVWSHVCVDCSIGTQTQGTIMVRSGRCEVEFDQVGTSNSNSHRVGSLIYACFICFIVFVSLLTWYKRRNHPYLRSRSLQLISLSSLGVLMELVAGSLVRAIPDRLSCEFVAFCTYCCIVYLVSVFLHLKPNGIPLLYPTTFLMTCCTY